MFFANPILGALMIFLVRVVSISLSTLRVLIMGRSAKLWVGLIAFFEALTFVLTFGQVAQDLNNIWNVGAYCLGFAAGTMTGIWIEERVIKGYATLNIISRQKTVAISSAIRKAGFGATSSIGRGTEGSVGIIRSVVPRRAAQNLIELIDDIDDQAFVTIEDTRRVTRGFTGYGRR